ncbi:MAG: class I SAM-dependent methyltransferase [Planctomycetes bacterium]|nr:class I SAM-dependent methyltransferase [Planctomycetota bacterium]
MSDTALWAAAFRALESERADAVFRDPLARMLAGDRGMKAVREMPSGTKHSWAWVTRTWSFDRLIDRAIREGADAVINLAAGLDARPYRMDLPPALKWVEVDLPELLTYKEEVLKSETARCRLERVAMDLSNMAARRALFETRRSRGEEGGGYHRGTPHLSVARGGRRAGWRSRGNAGNAALGDRCLLAGASSNFTEEHRRSASRGRRAAEIRSGGGNRLF